ncbi:hypothetical protein ACHAXT_011480 [Thalassiosira profunda]
MPSKPNLLAVAALLALAAASSAVDAAPAKNGLRKKRDDRKLRRGRIATGATNTKRAARGGLEEDVAFWTNLVRRTQDLSVPNGGGGDQGGGGVGATPAPVGTTPTPPSPTPPTPPTPGTTITTPPVPVVGVICAQGETCTDVGDVCTDGTTEECCGEVFDSFVCECKTVGDVLSFDCGMTDACLNKVCDDDGDGGGAPPPPTPDTGGFNCPDPSIVQCTAVDPSNPVDECQDVGEPCPNANAGEFCCRDTCRKYCTAKQAPSSIKRSSVTETTSTIFWAPIENEGWRN